MATKPDREFLRDTFRPSNHNYLSSNFFRIEIGRAPTVAYFAQQVDIPSIDLAELIQPTTLSTVVNIPGNQYQFRPLSVSFLMDEEMRGWREIYDWITVIANYKSTENTLKHKDKFSDIQLILTNSSYKGKFQITFRNAYPSTLSSIPLNITSTDNVPLIGTAVFKYTYFEFSTLT